MIPEKSAHKLSNRGTQVTGPQRKRRNKMVELSNEVLDSIASAAEKKADKTHAEPKIEEKVEKEEEKVEKKPKAEKEKEKEEPKEETNEIDNPAPEKKAEIPEGEDHSEGELDENAETKPKEDEPDEDKPDDGKLSDADLLKESDEDLSEEQIERKNELIKVKKDRDDLFEKDVKSLSEEKNISVEEAKEQLEAEDKFSDKYGKDPRKLSRTARELQQINSKQEVKIKELEEKTFTIDLTDREIMIGGQIMNKDSLVDAYLKEFPKEKDRAIREYDKKYPDNILEDDEKWEKAKPVIFDWIKHDVIEVKRKNAKEQSAVILTKAKEKRDTLISKISKSDKPYISSVKKILDHTRDEVVLGESFDVEALLNHERGRLDNIKRVKKEAEDIGYKRGLEKANILGVKGGGPERKSSIPRGKNSTFGLSKEAQTDALRMFSGSAYSNMSNYDKFKEYSELNIGELKTK